MTVSNIIITEFVNMANWHAWSSPIWLCSHKKRIFLAHSSKRVEHILILTLDAIKLLLLMQPDHTRYRIKIHCTCTLNVMSHIMHECWSLSYFLRLYKQATTGRGEPQKSEPWLVTMYKAIMRKTKTKKFLPLCWRRRQEWVVGVRRSEASPEC